MTLVEPKVELLTEQNGMEGIINSVARAARICYASNKTDNNAELVKRLIDSGHGRPLEFGTIYLTIPKSEYLSYYQDIFTEPYSRIVQHHDNVYITTNYRFIIEHMLQSVMSQYMTDPIRFHISRITLLWTISRGIADEFRTHTSISSLMQSTRYCNYSKDKFGNELKFIRPQWFDPNAPMSEDKETLIKSLEQSEYAYLKLCAENRTAQEAREVLPLSIQTQMIQCGFEDSWKEFFKQRVFGTTGTPHPDAKFIASQALELCQQSCYLVEG